MRIVEAVSIKDYLNKYYKKNRITETLLATYEAEYAETGYICTSKHDNVIGEFIVWSENPDNFPEWATK